MRTIDQLLSRAASQIKNPVDNYHDIMERLQLKLGSVEIAIPDSLQEIQTMKRANKKLLRAMEVEEISTGDARIKYQESLIDMYEKAGKFKDAKVVKKILKAEALARVWVDCSKARGLNKGGGLSYVLEPTDPAEPPTNDCQEWSKVTDPTEVRAKVSQRLQQHFSQSKGCNLTSPPLDVTMDFEGNCEKAEAILNGTFGYSIVDETKKWLLES